MTWQEIHELYNIHASAGEGHNLGPRQNISPTQNLHFCTASNGERIIKTGQWWLVPAWAKEFSTKYPTFNARAEAAHEKPTFRSAFSSRRCLIPANGYYEWTKGDDGKKDPWYIHLDKKPFSFAGLWEFNERLALTSCTVLTLPSVGEIQPIHNRMPAILKTSVWDAWLSAETSIEEARGLLKQNHGTDLSAYRVDRRVNSSRYSGDDCTVAI